MSYHYQMRRLVFHTLFSFLLLFAKLSIKLSLFAKFATPYLKT